MGQFQRSYNNPPRRDNGHDSRDIHLSFQVRGRGDGEGYVHRVPPGHNPRHHLGSQPVKLYPVERSCGSQPVKLYPIERSCGGQPIKLHPVEHYPREVVRLNPQPREVYVVPRPVEVIPRNHAAFSLTKHRGATHVYAAVGTDNWGLEFGATKRR